MRRLMGVLVIACLGALVLPAAAGAGSPAELDVDLESPVEPLTFGATILGPTCDEGSIVVTTLLLNGAPVEPVSITEDPTDPNTALIVLPSDSPPGALVAVVSCTVGGLPLVPLTDIQGFSAIPVTKVVEGTVPPEATFVVNVDCVDAEPEDVSFDGVSPADLPPDFAVDLDYDATGGLGYVYTDHFVECTVTEPEDGGATSVTIDPETLSLPEPADYPVTVTNTFPSPIVVAPTFTG